MNQPKLKEIFLDNGNPFVEISKKGKGKNFEIIQQSPGSPLCYKDYNNGPYVIAIINENFEFQYFDKITMVFLSAMIYKGKLFRKKSNKSIDEENIAKLDLKGYNFVPLDIKYLNHFYLKNLCILDLSNNSINSEGAFYLSRGKFSSLEKLNLNNDKIGDEGLNHIANGFFISLYSLYLSYNNISSKGIKYLIKAGFTNNLILLSLSGNPEIGDNGIKYMKEHDGWRKLTTLNLYYTGLTDISLDYIAESSMPKLKKFNIQLIQ